MALPTSGTISLEDIYQEAERDTSYAGGRNLLNLEASSWGYKPNPEGAPSKSLRAFLGASKLNIDEAVTLEEATGVYRGTCAVARVTDSRAIVAYQKQNGANYDMIVHVVDTSGSMSFLSGQTQTIATGLSSTIYETKLIVHSDDATRVTFIIAYRSGTTTVSLRKFNVHKTATSLVIGSVSNLVTITKTDLTFGNHHSWDICANQYDSVNIRWYFWFGYGINASGAGLVGAGQYYFTNAGGLVEVDSIDIDFVLSSGNPGYIALGWNGNYNDNCLATWAIGTTAQPFYCCQLRTASGIAYKTSDATITLSPPLGTDNSMGGKGLCIMGVTTGQYLISGTILNTSTGQKPFVAYVSTGLPTVTPSVLEVDQASENNLQRKKLVKASTSKLIQFLDHDPTIPPDSPFIQYGTYSFGARTISFQSDIPFTSGVSLTGDLDALSSTEAIGIFVEATSNDLLISKFNIY